VDVSGVDMTRMVSKRLLLKRSIRSGNSFPICALNSHLPTGPYRQRLGHGQIPSESNWRIPRAMVHGSSGTATRARHGLCHDGTQVPGFWISSSCIGFTRGEHSCGDPRIALYRSHACTVGGATGQSRIRVEGRDQ